MDARGDTPLSAVEDLLRRRIGLNPEAIQPAHVADAVRQRMAAWHLEDAPSYVQLLQADGGEFEELVELLLVPESWFFRDAQPFRCLQSYVREHWKPRQPRQPLRVLCVPCCAGEEPYSAAMTLLGLGLGAREFCIDGVDISRRLLQRARDGTYDDSAFRERDEEFLGLRARFCERTGDRYVVRDEVRTPVRFRPANLVAADFLVGEQPYQVVFCRNLLIYLHTSAREAALANLHRLMEPDGLLYVGHVEATAVTRGPFRLFSPAFPFAFRPLAPGDTRPSQASPVPPAPAALSRKTPSCLSAAVQAPHVELAVLEGKDREQATVPDSRARIEEARRAADQGHLDEAAALCMELLQGQPSMADVLCLLAVIRQAQGDLDEAERCFQRALYLEPRNQEALVHMALLAQRRGDERQAANFRRRAERVAHERN